MNELNNAAMIIAAIIALETEALEEWNRGNPSGYLNIYADDVSYFDPFTEKRINGLDKMKDYYEPLAGQIQAESYEMIEPSVSLSESMAVLSYNLKSFDGKTAYRWNCTQVYRLENDGQWKIVHNHWSITEPEKQATN